MLIKTFLGMSREAVLMYRDYFDRFGCITNNLQQILPFETQHAISAFEDANGEPDFKALSGETYITVGTLRKLHDVWIASFSLPWIEDQNAKQLLTAKLKSGLSDAAITRSLLRKLNGLTKADVLAYQEFYRKTGCVTNHIEAVLPYEELRAHKAFELSKISPDFFAISKATFITTATLKVLYEEGP